MAFFDFENSLDMLLIGRAGNGKSSTGNKFLGRETFLSSSDTQSTTVQAQFDFCEFEGNVLKVVDCPGLGDTRVGVEDDAKQLVDALRTAIANNPKGFHAILYIVRFKPCKPSKLWWVKIL
ncbi:unnamed protein product [Lymnaea stagnalis]|uniref:AIG1-type G domain-containing protein n=1 Tax=Lymnaea stagnalis TaxID=6523 RepID=A0AAV2IAE0_LYMST